MLHLMCSVTLSAKTSTKTFHYPQLLSTIFLIFFSLIENSNLLNLHARQKIKVLSDERNTKATGWMKCLSRTLYKQMSDQDKGVEEMLFTSSELLQFTDEEKRITPLTVKLDELAIALNLIPHKKAPKTKLLPISQKEI